MRLAFLYLIFINLLDFVTTAMLIERHGYWVEANPLLYLSMVAADSVYPILIAKIVPMFIFGIAMWTMQKFYPDRYKLSIWIWMVMAINVGLTAVVIRSIYAITYLQ